MVQKYSLHLLVLVLCVVGLITSYFLMSLLMSRPMLRQFFSSVYPTISSGKSTKVMIVSTPHGMNQFYKLWVDAEEGRNSYVPIEVHWSEVPGRDECRGRAETIKNTSESQFNTEFECEFLGSIDTLITPSKLRTMTYREPTQSNAGLDVHAPPQKDRTYVMTADVSRGTKNDYSAFCVIDVTELPYKIVAKYRDNEVKPLYFLKRYMRLPVRIINHLY